jgi:hypothetical protein
VLVGSTVEHQMRACYQFQLQKMSACCLVLDSVAAESAVFKSN